MWHLALLSLALVLLTLLLTSNADQLNTLAPTASSFQVLQDNQRSLVSSHTAESIAGTSEVPAPCSNLSKFESFSSMLLQINEPGNTVTYETVSTKHRISLLKMSPAPPEGIPATSTKPVPLLSPRLWPNGLSELLFANLTDHTDQSPANLSRDDPLVEENRFMSFEEWKKMKENAVKQKSSASASLLKASDVALNTQVQARNILDKALNDSIDEPGRTYKDRFNYASVDCAATVVKTNSDAKGAMAILTEVKDSYLLNKCSSSNKFVVIELCQDILVESVVLGNFELFSSMFRSVRFSVSDRFPVTDGWNELGQFEAQNIRDIQTFEIENPLIWARYLKIEILSHYGEEFYCPISLVRVHGTTMMEQFKNTKLEADSTASSAVPAAQSVKTENKTSLEVDDDDGCKVIPPYLTLAEFLKGHNQTSDFCEVVLPQDNDTSTTIESSSTKVTQESIFQNIVKRLSLLELNASLSLLYVEEQSKLLSDAFSSLEKKHARRFEGLLLQFNATLSSQITFLENSIDAIKNEAQFSVSTTLKQTETSLKNLRLISDSLKANLAFLEKVLFVDTIIILVLVAYILISKQLSMAGAIIEKHKPTSNPGTVMDGLAVTHTRHKHKRKKNH